MKSEFLVEIGAEILVWQEEDGALSVDFSEDFFGVSGGDAEVDEGFCFGGRVDVCDEEVVGVIFFELSEFVGRAHVGHGASGVLGRHEDVCARGEEFGGFAHEPHAAENDVFSVIFGGFSAEFQGVPDEIGDILHIALDIVVCQDDGIILSFEFENILSEFLCICRCIHNECLAAPFGAGMSGVEDFPVSAMGAWVHVVGKSVRLKGLYFCSAGS